MLIVFWEVGEVSTNEHFLALSISLLNLTLLRVNKLNKLAPLIQIAPGHSLDDNNNR
jgi:hypothetical protein